MFEASVGAVDHDTQRLDDGAWARVRNRLKSDLGEEVFSCWFAGMNVEQIEGGTVVLSAVATAATCRRSAINCA